MTAIIYRRTASATGPDGDIQLAQCRALAASRGWEVTEVFTDQGASAGTDVSDMVKTARLACAGQ